MKKLIPFFAAAALLVGTVENAEAQLGLKFGPQVSYGMEVEEVALGARVEVSPALMPLAFIASADYYFIEGDASLWSLNGTVKYTLALPASPIAPYFGAGLNLYRIDEGALGSSNETGFNILGGIGLGGILPIGAFLEGRYELTDPDNQLVISLGLLF